MDGSTPVELIGGALLVLEGYVLVLQGHFIVHGHFGYRHCEREEQKRVDTRKRVEEIIKDN
jgi:hypothetical protein